jgi:hypothetical protein
LEITAPLPTRPQRRTLSLTAPAKLAVTDWFVLTVIVHGLLCPAQAPSHPVNTEPVAGWALRVTAAPTT